VITKKLLEVIHIKECRPGVPVRNTGFIAVIENALVIPIRITIGQVPP
jgi:hypothetical protein